MKIGHRPRWSVAGLAADDSCQSEGGLVAVIVYWRLKLCLGVSLRFASAQMFFVQEASEALSRMRW